MASAKARALIATPSGRPATLDALRANGGVAERFDGYIERRDARAGAKTQAVIK